MAHVVQYKLELERMVNELDGLQRRGLFSPREIAEIIKQRRKFEYRLKRPSPLKQDCLAHIDCEKSLKRPTNTAYESSDAWKRRCEADFARISRIVGKGEMDI